MARSAIYTVSTNSTVAADGLIPLGTVIRRFGCDVRLEGDSVTCNGRGYYHASASVSLTPTAAGAIGIQLYQDGSPVPGALAIGTGTAGDAVNLSVNALVRQVQCGATSLSLRLVSYGASTGATVDNCPFVVKKI